jgi:transcriptional regulator with XRE-family HTH domain
MQEIENLPNDYMHKLHINIGKKVKQIREEKGLTQLQLSQAIGHKSVTIISRAEIHYNNKQRFNIEHLAKIAFVLEVDMCEFFNFE